MGESIYFKNLNRLESDDLDRWIDKAIKNILDILEVPAWGKTAGASTKVPSNPTIQRTNMSTLLSSQKEAEIEDLTGITFKFPHFH